MTDPTFAPFKLALHRLAEQIGALFPFGQCGVDPLERAGREPSRGLFLVDLTAPHRRDLSATVENKRYHLLTGAEYMISCNCQPMEGRDGQI